MLHNGCLYYGIYSACLDVSRRYRTTVMSRNVSIWKTRGWISCSYEPDDINGTTASLPAGWPAHTIHISFCGVGICQRPGDSDPTEYAGSQSRVPRGYSCHSLDLMVCSLKPQHAACLDNISVWIEVPRLFPPILVSSSRTVSGTIVKATNSDVMSSKCCDWTFFWGGFWVFLPMCFLDPGLQETPSTVQSVQPIDWRGVSPICNLSVNIRTMSKKRCGRVSEMDFTITFLRIVYLQSKNVRWVIENPATSLLWRYRCIRDAWALVQACLNLQYFFLEHGSTWVDVWSHAFTQIFTYTYTYI